MTKRILIVFLTLLSSFYITAQNPFSVSTPDHYTILTGTQYRLDGLIIFDKISVGAQLIYTGTGNFQWSYSVGSDTYTSTMNSVDVYPNTLYTIKINGISRYHVYTLDYSEFPSSYQAINISEDPQTVCESLNLEILCDITPIYYIDSLGQRTFLPRTFTLQYTTSAWDGTSWNDSLAVTTLTPSSSPITTSVAAPLKNTYFEFFGDDISEQLGIISDTLYSDLYIAKAVQIHPKGEVIERNAKNEKDRTTQNSIAGSSPLVVQFTANANPADNLYYEWIIFKTTNPELYQRFSDPEVNYTFKESGDYIARLRVNSELCSATDSLNIKAHDSFIDVPNVFTPNGDGINDEFRVAYKSLKSFDIWIYNRWGRLVYHSTDPGSGWDGTINGRPASTGTYYYVINAYGSDYDNKNKPMHYRLSGDCNLLR